MEFVKSEREAIQQAMNYIQQQQSRLQDDYMKLLDRQRELDDIERAQEPKPEPVAVAVPEVPLAEAILSHNTRFGHTDTVQPSGAAGYSSMRNSRYGSEIEKLKDSDNKNRVAKNNTKNSPFRDISVVATEIKSILREAGVPMKAKDILAKLEDRGVKMTRFPHQTITQSMKYDNKIEKASFGYYQYRG